MPFGFFRPQAVVGSGRPSLAMTGASYETDDKVFGSSSLSGGYGKTAANVLPTSGPWTVGARFKIGGSGTRTLLGAGPGNTGGAFWIGCDGSNNLVVFVGTGFLVAGAVYTDTWYEVELDFDPAGRATAFLNGGLMGDADGASQAINYSHPFCVGALPDGSTLWGGTIDEVHVWSTVRHTGAYTVPSAAYVGNEPGLIALYHLDGSGVSA